jgi:hypothetical protein
MNGEIDRWAHLDPYLSRCCRDLIRLYDEIEAMTTDITTIANTYQLRVEEVTRAKDHAFGNGVSRYQFIPDLDMAEAWRRMARGEGTSVDEVLLRHEILESALILDRGITQKQAHDIAQERYPWSELLGEANR